MADISELFSAPNSGIKGIANLFLSVGTVVETDPNSLTCKVLSNQGLLENVRLMFAMMSNASGMYALPNPGDAVTVSYTVQGDPFITGYVGLNPRRALENFDRVNIDYNSVVLTSNKRSLLVVSDDIHLGTVSGNHLLLNNNSSDPAAVLESSNRITLRTGVDPDATTIDIIKDVGANKTTLSIKANGSSSNALLLDIDSSGKVTMTISQELVMKFDGVSANSTLVSKQDVQDAINSVITQVNAASYGGNPIVTPLTPPTVTGINKFKVEAK